MWCIDMYWTIAWNYSAVSFRVKIYEEQRKTVSTSLVTNWTILKHSKQEFGFSFFIEVKKREQYFRLITNFPKSFATHVNAWCWLRSQKQLKTTDNQFHSNEKRKVITFFLTLVNDRSFAYNYNDCAKLQMKTFQQAPNSVKFKTVLRLSGAKYKTAQMLTFILIFKCGLHKANIVAEHSMRAFFSHRQMFGFFGSEQSPLFYFKSLSSHTRLIGWDLFLCLLSFFFGAICMCSIFLLVSFRLICSALTISSSANRVRSWTIRTGHLSNIKATKFPIDSNDIISVTSIFSIVCEFGFANFTSFAKRTENNLLLNVFYMIGISLATMCHNTKCLVQLNRGHILKFHNTLASSQSRATSKMEQWKSASSYIERNKFKPRGIEHFS